MRRGRRLATVAVLAVLLTGGTASLALAADRTRGSQWHLAALKVAAAHEYSTGKGVTVALIDSGVYPHRDLSGCLVPGKDFVQPSGNGQRDTDGHGTNMAGLIAAHGHGGDAGALGVAPGAKVLPVRIPFGKSLGLDKYIEYAVERHVGVISMSFSSGTAIASLSAVQQALRSDIVLVAAVGNRPGDNLPIAPANYPGVLAVGATDKSGAVADVSVRASAVQLVAPGVDIVSTNNDGGYGTGTGTSASTAIVAGAAALVRSRFPELSAEEVVHRLTATAIDKGTPGRDEEYGYGVLNLVGALTADVPPLHPSATPTPAPATTRPQAAPTPTPPAESTALWYVLGGLLLAVLIGGGIVVMIVMRRRPTGGH